jgi:hypothetical protein
MKRDEIIRMARQAGAERSCINDEVWMLALAETGFEKFAELVAAAEREHRAFEIAECYRCGWDGGVKAEREACARVCDDWPNGRDDIYSIGVAIRARSEK